MVIKSPKNKGSAGERDVILLLTTWATQVGVALHLERNLEKRVTAIPKRIGRRIAGKITGRLMGSIFPPTR